jgi:ribosomal protein S27AE
MRICPHCGAEQPNTFDAFCGQCRRLVEDAEPTSAAEQVKAEPPRPPADTAASITKAPRRPAELPSAPVGAVAAQPCPKCGAGQIIGNVHLTEPTTGKELGATVYMNPDAILFTAPISRRLSAHVCGDCGYTELYVADAKGLLDAAAEAPEHHGLPAPVPRDEPYETMCLRCGAPMAEDRTACAACGWSYEVAEQPGSGEPAT